MWCRFCRNRIDDSDKVCIHCGRDVKTGKKVTGSAEKTRTRKSGFLVKMLLNSLLVVVLGGAIVVGMYYILEWQKDRKDKAELREQQRRANLPPDNTVGTDEPTENIIPENQRAAEILPEIERVPDTDKYRIRRSVRTSRRRVNARNTATPEYRFSMEMTVNGIPPKGREEPLRLKIYQGDQPEGKYKLVYDRVAQIDTHTMSSRIPARMPSKFRPPQNSRASSEVDAAQFSFSVVNPTHEKGSDIYYRLILCREDGTPIKEDRVFLWDFSRYDRLDRRVVSGPSHSGGVGNISEMRFLINFKGDKAYPRFTSNGKYLEFKAGHKGAFRVTGIRINGITYSPYLIKTDGKSLVSRKGQREKAFVTQLSLNYPFGGKTEVAFHYTDMNGKDSKHIIEFALPPQAPVIKLTRDLERNGVKISWTGIGKEINKDDYVEVPELVLRRNNKEIARFKPGEQDHFVDGKVFYGEPVQYTMALVGGMCKAVLWSPEKGLVKFNARIESQTNPYQKSGASVVVTSADAKSHPVRIELLKSFICYENTGATACRLIEEVLNAAAQRPEMVFYDRDSRDYIVDEKFFAMSNSLKKQFLMREADYAVQLKDYSRQDGNGVEIWLFKKCIGGRYVRKSTKYWKIGEIPSVGKESLPVNAGELVSKLFDKIEKTVDFKTCADERQKNIVPKNIVCPSLRPLNEVCVIRNSDAISESLFLGMTEKNSEIKIMSQANWQEVFKERLTRFDEGHRVIDHMIREVILQGRICRDGKNTKNYFMRACDAFTGEVIACRTFTGKVRQVTEDMAEWIREFRLSDDVKADFEMSKYFSKATVVRLQKPWHPKENLLKNFGTYIRKPRKLRSYLKKTYKKASSKQAKSFMDIVKRQWKDGYRLKAVSMLEKKWKKEKKTTIGYLLSGYYYKLGNYSGTLAIYNTLLERDDCPEAIQEMYDTVQDKSEGGGNKDWRVKADNPVPKKKSVLGGKEEKVIADGGWFRYVDNIPDDEKMDYSATVVVPGKYCGQKDTYTKKMYRIFWEDIDNFEKYFFIDRDRIDGEWSPGTPCRTGTLVLKVPGKLLSDGVKNSVVRKYGVWKDLFLRRADFDIERNGACDCTKFLGRVSTYPKYSSRATNNSYVYVIEAAWQSIDPFSKKLKGARAYTRLGYFFKIFDERKSKLERLYPYSKVRCFFELKKRPGMSFPTFQYVSNELSRYDRVTTLIANSTDMIHYYFAEAEFKYQRQVKRKDFEPDEYPLYQLLAMDYMADAGNSNARIMRNKILSMKLPSIDKKPLMSGLSGDLLVYLAYKKNKQAVKILYKAIENRYFHDAREVEDFLYVLAMRGYKRLTAEMATRASSISGMGAGVLRWAPKKVLSGILERYGCKLEQKDFCFLVFGTRDDDAARQLLLKASVTVLPEINQYFGKPPEEAYDEWHRRHLDKISSGKE